MLKKLTLHAEGLFSEQFNRLLQTTATKDRLLLHRKTICIRLSPLPHPLFFIFDEQVKVLFSQPKEPDAYAALSLIHLRELHQGRTITRLIKTNAIQLEGDVLLLQQFATLLNQIQMDPYEQISKLLGDPLTYWLQQTQTSLFKTGQTFWQTKTTQWQDHLQYEANLAPLSAEYNQFKSQVKAFEQTLALTETYFLKAEATHENL